MSTTRSFDEPFHPYKGVNIGSALARLGRSLGTYWDALADGLAAARSYNELIRRGVPHDTAVREVFDAHFGI